jgi:hypothetical protein
MPVECTASILWVTELVQVDAEVVGRRAVIITQNSLRVFGQLQIQRVGRRDKIAYAILGNRNSHWLCYFNAIHELTGSGNRNVLDKMTLH